MVTALKKGPEEVGAMDFPFVVELLDYWLECPPEHLLLRTMAQYEGQKKADVVPMDSRRKQRAIEMGDTVYQPPPAQEGVASAAVASIGGRMQNKAFAPGHIKEAIDRAKRGEQLNIPGCP